MVVAVPDVRRCLFLRIHAYYDARSRDTRHRRASPATAAIASTLVDRAGDRRVPPHRARDLRGALARRRGASPSRSSSTAATSERRTEALEQRVGDVEPGVPLQVLHTDYASVVEPIVAFIDELRAEGRQADRRAHPGRCSRPRPLSVPPQPDRPRALRGAAEAALTSSSPGSACRSRCRRADRPVPVTRRVRRYHADASSPQRRPGLATRVPQPGGVPERTNGPVLKTGVGQPTVGSNPTPSATGLIRAFASILDRAP